jgi:pectate lyase
VIRFGSGSSWLSKPVTSAGQCTASFFGADSAAGEYRSCQVSTSTAVETVAGYAAANPTGVVTGGAGGERVTVTTTAELAAAVCSSHDAAGLCTDKTPRIVQVSGVIDFTGTAGKTTSKGCVYADMSRDACKALPADKLERILPTTGGGQCDAATVFDITYDTAASKPLHIGSNKTLIGLGDGAGIKGKGLTLSSSDNIIVRNLAITDINAGVIFAGDAITFDKTDRVWIDHNRIARIGRQFIVSHFGQASNVTISNNDFDGTSDFGHYCNGKHYWNFLLIGADDSMTMVGNWIRHFSGRGPKVGGGQTPTRMHLVNNFFEDGYWIALSAMSQTSVLVEGNYFKDVAIPLSDDAGLVFAPLSQPTAAGNSACQAALKRNCVGNVVSATPVQNNFKEDSTVFDAFKLDPSGALIAPQPADSMPTVVPTKAGPRSTIFM